MKVKAVAERNARGSRKKKLRMEGRAWAVGGIRCDS